jgi:plastocyanin
VTSTSKKTTVILYGLLTVVLAVGAIFGAVWVTHTQTAQAANGKRRCENAQSKHYAVRIQDEKVIPAVTHAAKCDTLTITNTDAQVRLMAFGEHDDHVSYDGVSERQLGQSQSLTITLVKTGTYIFHDHADDVVQGAFVVR